MEDVAISIDLTEEDGPIEMIPLAQMMIDQLKETGNPTIDDWENLKVAFSNVAVVLGQLADQEIENLRKEQNA